MDLTLQIPLQSGTMFLLWSEAINSLYSSLLEFLVEIREHVLKKSQLIYIQIFAYNLDVRQHVVHCNAIYITVAGRYSIKVHPP